MQTNTLKTINNNSHQQISQYNDQLEQWSMDHIKDFNNGDHITINTNHKTGTHNMGEAFLTNFLEETSGNLMHCTNKNKCMSKSKTKKSKNNPGNNNTTLSRIKASQEDIYQAKKLATNTLQNYSDLLGKNQAHTLNNFLSRKGRMKGKITQGQCMKIFNITVQAQNKFMKLNFQK